MKAHLIAAVAWLGLAAPAFAAEPPAPVPMAEPALSAVRGGLMTPLGVELGFAAAMHTYVDGSLVLETHIAWTPDGLVQSQSGPLSDAAAPEGWSGALKGLTGGETQILQSAGGGQLLSVIANTADNRNIRQDTDIVLTLPQLADLQRQVGAQHISSMLQAALNTALQGSAGR